MVKPTRIYVPQPPMGAKAFLIEEPGMFVLEEGPGTLITDACTHAGGGSLLLIDGIPDERGYFSDPPVKPEWRVGANPLGELDDINAKALADFHEAYGKRHGRHIARFNPVVMGSWMLNAGFHNGLTVEVSGAHQGMAPVATIVWQPFRGAKIA